jgi:beta-1,2-mannobiose phosphorylase / 1,2-beta-oligomannan phosphorylase
MRSLLRSLIIVLALGGSVAQAQDFPADMVSWTLLEPQPVFTGAGGDAWDKLIRERGWILVENGVYHLWYTGYNPERSPNMFLGHATSPDGLRWTRDPQNPLLTDSWVEDMCVIHDGNAYYMIAEGKGDIAHLLTSPDPTHWVERGPLDVRLKSGEPISPGPRGTPAVYTEGGIFYLFYERNDLGIWLATSKDKLVWTNVQDEPVLALGPDNYDLHLVAMNQVVKRDGVYYGFYHANAPKPAKDWTTNVARSRDMIHWEKYKGNPIIDSNCSSGILVEGPAGRRFYTMHPEVRVFVNKPNGEKP